MDRRKTKKKQNTRIVMTNIFMGLSVIAIVTILMLVAMGFTFNERGGLEQSGLLQISSHPGGATVEIDNNVQFNRTELSKMLRAGRHTVKVTKDGYDSWETTVRINAGLLTNISWVRLFPEKPTIEDLVIYKQARLLSFSSDRKNLLYLEQNSSMLELVNLQGELLKQTNINLSTILETDDTDILKNAKLSVVSWNASSNKVLLNWTHDEKTDWILANLERPENSINLSHKFNLNFSNILIANDSASKLWGVENGNLRLIDLGNSTISITKATGILRIANNQDTVAYLRTNYVAPKPVEEDEEDNEKTDDEKADQDSQKKDDKNNKDKKVEEEPQEPQVLTIELYKEGESGATEILNLDGLEPANFTIALGTYWGEEWLAYSIDNNLNILAGKYPSFDKPAKNALKSILKRDVDHAPTQLLVNSEKRIAVFHSANKLTSFDLETKDYYDIELSSENNVGWLDDYILWQYDNDKVTIRDFNGDNLREVISKTNNQLPICLTNNNRWLYYFSISAKEPENNTKANLENDAENQEVVEEPIVQDVEYTLHREKLNI